MTVLSYSIYSPSRGLWLKADGGYGPYEKAERFPSKDKTVILEGDQRWVGPNAEGEHK
jgi:hypothetical protein